MTWRKRREIAEPTPEAMAKACRKLARDMRREAAAGWDDVELIGRVRITRAEAARRMDAAAERWTRRRNDGRGGGTMGGDDTP